MFALKCIATTFLLFNYNKFAESSSQVNVTLYYETLCPYCIEFVTKQLYPTYTELKLYVSIDLIPFGHAKEKYTFTCQHGPNECHGNKIHSCILNYLPKDDAISFINCAMNHADSTSNSTMNYCLDYLRLTKKDIVQCLETSISDKLLVKMGLRTQKLVPKLDHVPTIVLDGIYDGTTDELARTNLKAVVCKKLGASAPKECSNFVESNRVDENWVNMREDVGLDT